MPARLPQPGGDNGDWGDILNEFLLEAHNPDGSLKPLTQAQISGLAAALAEKADVSSVVQRYVKPAGGIPETDLAAGVAVKLNAAAPVQSVAGKTGIVSLAKEDVGLSNVDDTDDLSKPISTAMQTALAAKASQAALDSLSTTVSSKADATALALKADASDLAAKVNAADLAAVATTGNYSSLLNKPTLSTVAGSGSYSDLTDKPSIPDVSGLAATTYVDNQVASAKNRTNHTGTQSADTITDGTTNKIMTASERALISGATDSATASTLVKRDLAGATVLQQLTLSAAAPTLPAHAVRKDYVDARIKQVFMAAHNGTGSGATSSFTIAAAFTTIPLPVIDNDTNNAFNATTNLYTVPVAGFYAIEALIRVKDGDSLGSNIGIGVGTANADSASFAWYSVATSSGASASRNSFFYARTAHFNVGDQVRLFGYGDKTGGTAVTFAGASLSMMLMSAD